jgi:LPXTG-site transpeptidase (sortase) family protein
MTFSRHSRPKELLLVRVPRFSILAGVALLAWCGYVLVSAQVPQQRYAHLFQVNHDPVVSSCQGPRAPRRGEPVAKLEIPRIGISVVVFEGDDAHVLRLGAGQIPGTAMPGQNGNIAIAAHRDTFFRPLRNIRPGDVIQLVATGGSYTYSVKWTRIVNPRDTEVAAATSDPELTLITCYPFYYVGAAPKRFVVRAIEISTDQISGNCSRNMPRTN